jgi:hypothetical protein
MQEQGREESNRSAVESMGLPPRPENLGLPEDWLIVMPAAGHTMFRMVKQERPTEDDFLSDRVRGRPRYGEDLEADHLGVSMFAERVQAESIMRRYPKRIAEVRLAPDYGLCLARTLPGLDGHHTVWGQPGDLVRLVESVWEVPGP